MSSENFVPKILLCGNVIEFLKLVEQRPFQIIAQIEFIGKDFNFLKDGKFTVNGESHNRDELAQILRGGADYIVFSTLDTYRVFFGALISVGIAHTQILTVAQLNALPLNNLGDFSADMQLLNLLKVQKIKTLLDFDAHFVQSAIVAAQRKYLQPRLQKIF